MTEVQHGTPGYRQLLRHLNYERDPFLSVFFPSSLGVARGFFLDSFFLSNAPNGPHFSVGLNGRYSALFVLANYGIISANYTPYLPWIYRNAMAFNFLFTVIISYLRMMQLPTVNEQTCSSS